MIILDGSKINLFIAFVGGLVTFFASCLLPLVPTYLAYLGGLSTKNKSRKKNKIFINGVIFTVGFILAFLVLGATASSLGQVFSKHRLLIQKIGGVFFVLVGIFMLDLIKIPSLYKERKIKLPAKLRSLKLLNSLLVGFTFGFAWTPCIGPVLGVILFWASQAETFVKGMGLLFAYGIGMGVPFIIVAVFFEALSSKLTKATKFGSVLQKISALIIIAAGILLFTGNLNVISIKLIELLNMSRFSV